MVSSVLPRAKQNLYQQEFESVNKEIAEFNELLKAFCQNDPELTFLDNDESFISVFGVRDHLYRIHDETGTHLGSKGLDALGAIFSEAVVNLYYKTKLQLDYDVQVET